MDFPQFELKIILL